MRRWLTRLFILAALDSAVLGCFGLWLLVFSN